MAEVSYQIANGTLNVSLTGSSGNPIAPGSIPFSRYKAFMDAATTYALTANKYFGADNPEIPFLAAMTTDEDAKVDFEAASQETGLQQQADNLRATLIPV